MRSITEKENAKDEGEGVGLVRPPRGRETPHPTPKEEEEEEDPAASGVWGAPSSLASTASCTGDVLLGVEGCSAWGMGGGTRVVYPPACCVMA